MKTTLYYITDPMCSWCWGFAENFTKLLDHLPPRTDVRYVMGGLAPDNDSPMPEETRQYVQDQWRKVSTATGAKFNWDFWTKCEPRRSTYPACRAVIAAGLQSISGRASMIHAIQRAYYLEARNPSDLTTLRALADEIGLDAITFESDILSPYVEEALFADFALRRELGVTGFPTVLLQTDQNYFPLVIGQARWEQIQQNLAVALNPS